jgi:hypothetical protein
MPACPRPAFAIAPVASVVSKVRSSAGSYSPTTGPAYWVARSDYGVWSRSNHRVAIARETSRARASICKEDNVSGHKFKVGQTVRYRAPFGHAAAADYKIMQLLPAEDDELRYRIKSAYEPHGKWDLSLWDENFSGHWTLVGYHLDGGLQPTSYESYEVFQARRLAKR